MSLEKSKWAKAKKQPNPWREIDIHESNLIDAMEYALTYSKHLKRGERIERVLVGEPLNGVYPLSVAIVKREEV